MSDNKISDALVKIANDAQQDFFDAHKLSEFFCSGHYHEESMRAALEAALPHLHPQPAELAEQQGVGIQDSVGRLIEAIEGECDGLVIATETAAAILDHVCSDDRWREAVSSELALTFIDPKSKDPAEILRAVINWNVRTALDPTVSSDAAALAATGKQQADAVDELIESWTRQAKERFENNEFSVVAESLIICARELKAAIAVRQPGVG